MSDVESDLSFQVSDLEISEEIDQPNQRDDSFDTNNDDFEKESEISSNSKELREIKKKDEAIDEIEQLESFSIENSEDEHSNELSETITDKLKTNPFLKSGKAQTGIDFSKTIRPVVPPEFDAKEKNSEKSSNKSKLSSPKRLKELKPLTKLSPLPAIVDDRKLDISETLSSDILSELSLDFSESPELKQKNKLNQTEQTTEKIKRTTSKESKISEKINRDSIGDLIEDIGKEAANTASKFGLKDNKDALKAETQSNDHNVHPLEDDTSIITPRKDTKESTESKRHERRVTPTKAFNRTPDKTMRDSVKTSPVKTTTKPNFLKASSKQSISLKTPKREKKMLEKSASEQNTRSNFSFSFEKTDESDEQTHEYIEPKQMKKQKKEKQTESLAKIEDSSDSSKHSIYREMKDQLSLLTLGELMKLLRNVEKEIIVKDKITKLKRNKRERKSRKNRHDTKHKTAYEKHKKQEESEELFASNDDFESTFGRHKKSLLSNASLREMIEENERRRRELLQNVPNYQQNMFPMRRLAETPLIGYGYFNSSLSTLNNHFNPRSTPFTQTLSNDRTFGQSSYQFDNKLEIPFLSSYGIQSDTARFREIPNRKLKKSYLQ